MKYKDSRLHYRCIKKTHPRKARGRGGGARAARRRRGGNTKKGRLKCFRRPHSE